MAKSKPTKNKTKKTAHKRIAKSGIKKAAKKGAAKSAASQGNNNTDTVAKIQKIIADQLKKKPHDIPLAAQLQKDLGADSLDALEIIFNIEEGFNIHVGEQEAKTMITVQNVVDLVEFKVKNPAPKP